MKTETDKQDCTLECGFCYPREQGKNGPVKRIWSSDWLMFIPMCAKHAAESDKQKSETPPELHAA